MRTIAPGVSVGVSVPTTYTMHYANGPITYTERFSLIRLDKAVVAGAGASMAVALRAASQALSAVPMVGPALAGLVELAGAWYASASLERDGSVHLQLAYHYCGTKAGGMDLTAWPVPGVDARAWKRVVDLVAGAAKGPALDAVDAVGGVAVLEADAAAELRLEAEAKAVLPEGMPLSHAVEAVESPLDSEEGQAKIVAGMTNEELVRHLRYLLSLAHRNHAQEVSVDLIRREMAKRGIPPIRT